MTFVMKLSRLGGILIIVDAIFDIINLTSKNNPWTIGLICILLGVLIFLVSPQLEFDYKVQWSTVSIASAWFSHFYIHGILLYEWSTGLGFIGMIFVYIAGILVLLGSALGCLVVHNIGLFKPYRYFLFGIGVIALHNTVLFLFKIWDKILIEGLFLEFLSYGFIAVMLFGTLLFKMKKKIAGSVIIWISNHLNTAFTETNGFGAGNIVLGMFGFIAGMMAIHNHWADPYKRKTRIPRRDLPMMIKDAYFGFLFGILFGIKSLKAKEHNNKQKK